MKIIIQIAKNRQCLCLSKVKNLVNSTREQTPIQKILVEWKCKYSFFKTNYNMTEEDEIIANGKVRTGYWRGFMRRNAHKIVSKKGQKYESDHAKWSAYINFADMYNHISTKMEEADVAKKLE